MLSIIIITKNEEAYLPNLLKSISRQDVKYEIIVSDAKSTDKTREIAKKYNCKITEGGLPSKGRNNGAKISKYDLLLFLDADVILPKSFLYLNIREFKNRKLGCATTHYVPISHKTIDKMIYKGYNRFASVTQYFYPHSAGFCIFCRKDVFKKINGFNEKIMLAEDLDFVKRCGKVSKFRILSSIAILSDVRRLNKEGRWGLIKKYCRGELHRITKGEITKIPFDYELHGGTKLERNKQPQGGIK